MSNSKSWKKIFDDYKILNHNFVKEPFVLKSKQIKESCSIFTKTNEKEVRLLCKQDTRESRPDIFKENNLFLLPIKNGEFAIIKGEGYVDIPEITTEPIIYDSKLDFELETSLIGNSEMQHLDFAYASSLVRTFMKDPSLVLTIRGRKYTPEFDFRVGSQEIKVKGVQTEVDAGYEGRDNLVLVYFLKTNNLSLEIKKIFYPYKFWSSHISKKITSLLFRKNKNSYSIWLFRFTDLNNFNSIDLLNSNKFIIKTIS